MNGITITVTITNHNNTRPPQVQELDPEQTDAARQLLMVEKKKKQMDKREQDVSAKMLGAFSN